MYNYLYKFYAIIGPKLYYIKTHVAFLNFESVAFYEDFFKYKKLKREIEVWGFMNKALLT